MSEKRKITTIGSAHPLWGGGFITFNRRLAKAHADNCYDVEINTFSLLYHSFLVSGTTQYLNDAPPSGLNIKTRVNSINPLNWIKTGKENRKLKPYLAPTLFWIPFMVSCLGEKGVIPRKKSSIKSVAMVDNITPHEHNSQDRLLVIYFVKSVNCFVTISKPALTDLERFCTAKPKKLTVHSLYDNFGETISKIEALKQLYLSGKLDYILFFGFIREYKDLGLLINALSSKELRGLIVMVSADGELHIDSQPYFNMIDDFMLKGHVIKHNKFVPNTEVVNFFCASSLEMQHYKNTTHCGVTRVAYHFSKPMITNNFGGLLEIAPHGKVIYVAKPDADEISESAYNYFDKNKELEFTVNTNIEKKRHSCKNMLSIIESIANNT